MKIEIGTQVRVVRGTDDTFDDSFLGLTGIVKSHVTSGICGDTESDPLHICEFDLNTVPKSHPKYIQDAVRIEDFWYEELEIIK